MNHQDHTTDTTHDDSEGHGLVVNNPAAFTAQTPPPPPDDDTEGHRLKRGVQPEGEDDTEGHGYRGRWVQPEGEDDTEGHRWSKRVQPAGEDDTEGHVVFEARGDFRPRSAGLPDDTVTPTPGERRTGVDADDTEGHGWRRRP